LYKYDRCP